MPYPMVHLSVAHRMSELLQTELPPCFYLGSIAPDSIHMREGTGKADKSVTHLKLMPRNIVPPDLDHPEYIKAFIISNTTSDDPDQAFFIKGYAAHIMTDLYWLETMYQEYKQAVEPLIGKTERVALYKRECDQGDYLLYLKCAWRPAVWEMLQTAPTYEVSNLLSVEEVRKWKERVLGIYDIIAAKPDFEPQHMTVERLTEFSDRAAREMIHQFDVMQISLSNAQVRY